MTDIDVLISILCHSYISEDITKIIFILIEDQAYAELNLLFSIVFWIFHRPIARGHLLVSVA